MTVLDTSVVIERVKKGEEIRGYVTAVTIAEFPPLLEYAKFREEVLYPHQGGYGLSHRAAGEA